MPTRSLGRQEDGHAERPTTQAELTPNPHFLSQWTEGKVPGDKAAKEEIHATGNKTPGLREGRDGAACSAGLQVSTRLVALGKWLGFSEPPCSSLRWG